MSLQKLSNLTKVRMISLRTSSGIFGFLIFVFCNYFRWAKVSWLGKKNQFFLSLDSGFHPKVENRERGCFTTESCMALGEKFKCFLNSLFKLKSYGRVY